VIEVTNEEEKFNINDILKSVFISLQKEPDCNHCQLVYAMDKTVPKMFKGDVKTIEEYLVKVFYFILKINKQSEILVEIHGPKEFVYVDDIIFTMKNITVTEEDMDTLQKMVEYESNVLDAKLNAYSRTTLTIRLPFIISKLGGRRHYRLPSKSLLQKNVLIMATSQNITLSITKMFKYFPYNVDMSMQIFDESVCDLSQYDLLVVEDKLMSETLAKACQSVQQTKNLKCVILGKMENTDIKPSFTVSDSLYQPITQESIFELIISVFADQYDSEQFLEDKEKEAEVTSLTQNNFQNNELKTEKFVVKPLKTDTFQSILEDKKNKYTVVLDTKLGKKNAKKLRLNYDDELENFFDMFDGSDLYFRQIVNEKSLHKIKEFCIDLEKYSKIIGAESMLKFTEVISLMFVYKKTDTLPIYPGRYHIELKKLFKEMERYFS